MPRQWQDVARALRQRRQAQLDAVEAVEQVLAEAAVGDQRGKVGVGRADDAHRDAALAVAAQAFEAPGLQHPQQLDLPGQRQRADLVERSEEHTSELQSLMRISYAVFCLKKKKYEIKES